MREKKKKQKYLLFFRWPLSVLQLCPVVALWMLTRRAVLDTSESPVSPVYTRAFFVVYLPGSEDEMASWTVFLVSRNNAWLYVLMSLSLDCDYPSKYSRPFTVLRGLLLLIQFPRSWS